MADPQYPVNIPADTWTKVASGVVTGWIHQKKNTTKMLQTYRVVSLGNADPTDVSEGVPMFYDNQDKEEISSADAIDVWVYAVGEAGVLRVDV